MERKKTQSKDRFNPVLKTGSAKQAKLNADGSTSRHWRAMSGLWWQIITQHSQKRSSVGKRCKIKDKMLAQKGVLFFGGRVAVQDPGSP